MSAPVMQYLRQLRHADSATAQVLANVRRDVKGEKARSTFDEMVRICDRNGWALDPISGKLDAQTMAFATRQVEQILTETFEEEHPDLPMAEGDIVPINTAIADGAKFFIYYIHSGGGLARFASGYSNEYPMSHIESAEVAGRVRLIKGGYEFSEEDMVTARFAGENIEPRLQGHARRAHAELHHVTGLWGREDLGLPGLINHPNIQVTDAADNGSGSTFFVDKTADQILADYRTLVNNVRHVTFDIEKPNRILHPLEIVTFLSTTRLGGDNGTIFLMELVQKAFPEQEFRILQDLAATKSSGNLTEDSLFAYTFNMRKASLVMPRLFTMGQVQQNLDMIQIPATSKVGGIKMPVPLMCNRMDGVGDN